MLKDTFHFRHLTLSILVLLILISVTGVLCGGGGGATKFQQLQKLQNWAAKIITGSNYDVLSKPLIETLSWKTIKEMTLFDSQLMVFKSINGLAP